jgi:hypothetical protein
VAHTSASARLATLALLARAGTTLYLAALNFTTLDLATAHPASHCARHHAATTTLAAYVSAVASFLAALLVTLASFAGSCSSFN